MATGDLTAQALAPFAPVEELARNVILFLPNLLAAIVILIIGWILGRILGRVVAEVLDRIGVDDALRKTSIGQQIERSTTNISRLFDLIVRWFIYLIAILAAVSVLQIQALSAAVAAIVAFIPNIAAFIIILVGGFILIDWLMDRFQDFGAGQDVQFFGAVTTFLRVFLYFVVVILALQQLLLDLSIIYVFVVPLAWGVALGIGAAIAIIVGFGLRDRAPGMMDQLMGRLKKE
ncbi:mechanosensitive ion channel family protein [Methanoculleus sp. UBA389]|uniref:mechanosensitive ion channel family protein n=1 Tax=Methanoculleus sp. UBA389 TaxID=1915507 RepID=UPI0031BBC903